MGIPKMTGLQSLEEIERCKTAIECEESKPFGPRREVSADAKYLWNRIFVWFWVVPNRGWVAGIPILALITPAQNARNHF